MFPQRTAIQFVCEPCHFKCSKNCDYQRHLITAKHLRLSNATKMLQDDNKTLVDVPKKFNCDCGKIYTHSSSYYRHKKKCISNFNDTHKKLSEYDKDELIISLLKQNAELLKGQQDMFVKLTESKGNTNNSNNINSMNNNKTFNLQIFLNETCKDAMNITDFVNNVKVDLDDLENTGRIGYIEGITDIISKNLNKLENHLRPLHCSDLKREILYIKDNDEWTKETEEKPILTKAIKTIANENIKQIYKWREKYPDCTQADSKKNDLYLKIVSNSMNGLTKEEGEKNINKIISNVAKKVIIEKYCVTI
jgi:hypothetical protein